MNYHFLKSFFIILVGTLLFSNLLHSQRPNIRLDKDFNFIDIHPFSKSDFLLETRSPQKVMKTFDENWRLIEEIEQNWYVNEWVIIQKSIYTYDDNNNPIEMLGQLWVNNNEWVSFIKITYTYDDNNNQTESLNQTWNGNDWVNLWKYSYTYDDNNNRIDYLSQRWVDNDWVNSWKDIYIYDDNNNRIELLSQNWNDNDWVNYSKFTYVYEEILGIDISDITSIPNHYNLSNPYPNPFNPTTTIKFSIPRSDMVTIKVYDILGKEVTTLLTDYLTVGHHSIKWDGNNNSTGIYFIRMESGGFIDMKKVFLLK